MCSPPDGVPNVKPKWRKTGDCCGFIVAKQKAPSWRVAWHGSYQLNRVQMQLRSTDKATHCPVYVHLVATKAAARQYRKQRRREKRKSEKESLCCSAAMPSAYSLETLALFTIPSFATVSSGSSLSRWSWWSGSDAWQGWAESATTEPAAPEPVQTSGSRMPYIGCRTTPSFAKQSLALCTHSWQMLCANCL